MDFNLSFFFLIVCALCSLRNLCLYQGFSTSAHLTFGLDKSLLWGPSLALIRAPLVSPIRCQEQPFPPFVTNNNVLRHFKWPQGVGRRQNYLQLRTTGLLLRSKIFSPMFVSGSFIVLTLCLALWSILLVNFYVWCEEKVK